MLVDVLAELARADGSTGSSPSSFPTDPSSLAPSARAGERSGRVAPRTGRWSAFFRAGEPFLGRVRVAQRHANVVEV